jgi:hypothetical protein
MNERLKETLANLHDLATCGATDGEKKAARKAMDRIINKYGLGDIDINDLRKKTYRFKYTTKLEMWLLPRLRMVLLNWDGDVLYKTNHAVREGSYVAVREIKMELDEFDYITMECAYEYFRRHMKKQWKQLALPILKRCRKTTTRNKKREQLQVEFFNQYCIASKLFTQGELKKKNITSKAEMERVRAFRGVEGGEYKKQVSNGFYLES